MMMMLMMMMAMNLIHSQRFADRVLHNPSTHCARWCSRLHERAIYHIDLSDYPNSNTYDDERRAAAAAAAAWSSCVGATHLPSYSFETEAAQYKQMGKQQHDDIERHRVKYNNVVQCVRCCVGAVWECLGAHTSRMMLLVHCAFSRNDEAPSWWRSGCTAVRQCDRIEDTVALIIMVTLSLNEWCCCWTCAGDFGAELRALLLQNRIQNTLLSAEI